MKNKIGLTVGAIAAGVVAAGSELAETTIVRSAITGRNQGGAQDAARPGLDPANSHHQR